MSKLPRTRPGIAMLALTILAALALLCRSAAAQAPLRVWVSDINDQADKDTAAGAIQIVGARNGAFSGKVVASGAQALHNLRATCGDLKGPGGVIANVQIRYALPWTSERDRRMPNACLAEAPLKEYAPGAAAPVWITVRIPKDTAGCTRVR